MLTTNRGKQTELFAKNYLVQQGLLFVAENYSCRRGEIDLIFKDSEYTVFIEVKFRRSACYGSGFEAVHHKKKAKIIYAAQHYLHHHGLSEKAICRFDVISLSPTNEANNRHAFSLKWIKDAFNTQ